MPQLQTKDKRALLAWQKGSFSSNLKSPKFKKFNRFILKIILILGLPLSIIVAVELILRIAGYGYPIEFFAKTEDGQYLIPNPHFSKRFFPPDVIKEAWPFKIPVKKAEDTKRIFVIGDSAAQGTPAPAFGFARILEVMLQQQFPDKKFEIVNVAMRGINSHVMIPIARECAKYEPDAFLIYAGNNEIVGLYAPDPQGFNIVDYPFLIQIKHLFSTTKWYQLLSDITLKLGKSRKKEVQDFEYFQRHRIPFSHPSRISTARNFESNLEKICRTGIAGGAKVLLSTIAVNLQDCPPFGSLHKKGMTDDEINKWNYFVKLGDDEMTRGNTPTALDSYLKALAIDPQYAELNYKIAVCYTKLGDLNTAIEYYKAARDFDCLPFRADNRLNEAIRKTASRFNNSNLIFVDAELAFLSHSLSHGKAPDNTLFHEHVHLKFSGDYLLAKTFYEKLIPTLFPEIKKDNSILYNPPSEQECAFLLAYTPWDELDIAAAIVKLTTSPLFQGQFDHSVRQGLSERILNEKLKKITMADLKKCALMYEMAISKRPDDWQLHLNYGNLLQVMENYNLACREYQIVLKHVPFFQKAQYLHNTTLAYLNYQQGGVQPKH